MSLLIEESSRCVKCGLCLAECPTYALNANEAFSPRGRIALIESLARGTLEIDADVDVRLDSCLLCRRCEKICPSGVRFGIMMDEARGLTRQFRPFWLKTAVNTLTSAKKLQHITTLGKAFPILSKHNTYLSQQKAQAVATLNAHYPAATDPKGQVGLFTGCTGKALQSPTLHSAIQLLTQAGYEVHVPRDQGCCGALQAHLGDAPLGRQMLEQALAPFLDLGLQVVINITSGCSAQLNTHPDIEVMELQQFFAATGDQERLQFRPIRGTAALHIACSLENSPDGSGSLIDLLGKIPELDLQIIGKPGSCCGAAGSHFLSHPKTAEALRTPFIDAIRDLEPDYLLSSNIGCTMHLASGLKTSRMELLHPLSLLASALDT